MESGVLRFAYGGSIDVGANVLVYESNSTDAQKWAISTISNHGYRLQAKCSGLSLDVAGGGTSGGTNVRQFSSNDSYAQSWLFIPYEPYQPVEDGRYILLSGLDDGLELDVAGDSGDVGNLTNIQVWGDYAESRYNSFDITKLDNGYYKIIHAASGKAMDVNGGLSNHSSNVSLFNDNGSIAQQWAISKKDGYYVLKAKCSGYALDVEGGKTADGTNVSQYPYNGNILQANQSWKLVPAEYTISYDANGGENAPSSQTKYYKEDIEISTGTPKKEGYSFVEWNVEADGTGVAYRPGDAYADDRDMVLYAQYDKIPTDNDENTESVSADNTGKPSVSSDNKEEDDENELNDVSGNDADKPNRTVNNEKPEDNENTEDGQNNSEDGEGSVSEISDDNMNNIISDTENSTEEVSDNPDFTEDAGNEDSADADQKETVTTPDNTNPSNPQDTEEDREDESPYAGISVSDNKPMEYKTETVGSYEVSYCHQIPFWGKSAPTAADFGDMAVCYNGQSYKVTKVKVNKKKHLIQILNVEGADTKTEKEIKNATKGDKGLKFQVNPYFVTENDKVEVSVKKNGKIKSLKIQINDKEYKAKKSEYDFDKGSGTITFKGDNLKGSYILN